MEPVKSLNLNFFSNELKGFVYRRVKDRKLTEDIVHDVYLKVRHNLGQLKQNEKITGWIYQIARNTISDYFRGKSKSIHAFDLDWESMDNPLNDCVAHCLLELMSTLPDKYREALELAEFQSLPQMDLARKLNISYSGAKSRVQRARRMLKEKMTAQYHIQTDGYGNVILCENKVPCDCPHLYSEAM